MKVRISSFIVKVTQTGVKWYSYNVTKYTMRFECIPNKVSTWTTELDMQKQVWIVFKPWFEWVHKLMCYTQTHRSKESETFNGIHSPLQFELIEHNSNVLCFQMQCTDCKQFCIEPTTHTTIKWTENNKHSHITADQAYTRIAPE